VTLTHLQDGLSVTVAHRVATDPSGLIGGPELFEDAVEVNAFLMAPTSDPIPGEMNRL
jgi:hypothetical protein